MKIFDELEDLKKNLERYKLDYEDEYVDGYLSAISDLEERIKDKIEVMINGK